jgi:hypothetical protein
MIKTLRVITGPQNMMGSDMERKEKHYLTG